MGILLLIYFAAGYWATGHTIYANKVLIGTSSAIFRKKGLMALLLGWLLIPWAIIKVLRRG